MREPPLQHGLVAMGVRAAESAGLGERCARALESDRVFGLMGVPMPDAVASFVRNAYSNVISA